jgi:hypothetical protein
VRGGAGNDTCVVLETIGTVLLYTLSRFPPSLSYSRRYAEIRYAFKETLIYLCIMGIELIIFNNLEKKRPNRPLFQL